MGNLERAVTRDEASLCSPLCFFPVSVSMLLSALKHRTSSSTSSLYHIVQIQCIRYATLTTTKRKNISLQGTGWITADIMSPLRSSCIRDTRRPPAAFVGKTLTGSGKAVKALCPPVTQRPSQNRRHESILIQGDNYCKNLPFEGSK